MFPREQVLVLIYDDFRADNDETVREVLRFLAVDESVPALTVDPNPTLGMRSQRLDSALHAVSHGEGPLGRVAKRASSIVPSGVRRSTLRAAQRRLAWGEPPAPDERLMRSLRLRLRPEVEGLSEYLGRDLVALWGYDEIDAG